MDPEPLRELGIEEVMRKKDELEAELATLNAVLKSVSTCGRAGMCGVRIVPACL